MEIIKIEGTNVFYKCSCGVVGKCVIKPLSDVGEVVATITCPDCNKFITTVLSDSNVKQDEDTLYSFAIVLNNKILGD